MTEANDSPERRVHPRVDVTASATVLVRSNAAVDATIDSISLGGARLTGQFTLAANDRIRILFQVHGHPIEVTGEVIRVEARDLLRDRVAVRFLDLVGDARDLIRQLVLQTLELVEDLPSAASERDPT